MVEVSLLGRVAVTVDGVPLSGEAAQRRRVALVALLCVPAPRSLARDRLMLYLWPESRGESARHLLSVAVHVLRKALGHETLLTNGDEVALSPAGVKVDVAAFEEALRRGDVEGALTLYGGPFMDGFHAGAGAELEEWVAQERTRLERAYAQALEGAAAARARAGDANGAVDAWRKLAALDPYSSRGALGLMRALAEAGNRAAAIRHAAVHRQLLGGELGAGPDPEVEALAEALRVEPPAAPRPTVRPAPAVEPVSEPSAPSATFAPLPEATTSPPGSPASPTGDVAAPAALPPPLQWRMPRFWYAAAVALVLLVLTGYVAYRWWVRAQPRTVAVLPLTDASPQPGNEHLGEEISDEILNDLADVDGLLVAARASSFRFRGGSTDVREIGRQLRVQHVLDGSLEALQGRIRVNVELVNTRTGFHEWRQTFDMPAGNLFALQDSIARSVAERLKGRKPAPPERHQPTLAAYHLYLQGRQAWYQRTPQSLAQATSYFRQSIAADTLYARAYAGLAETLVVDGSYDYGGLPPDSAFPAARAAALRAIELDSTLAEPRAALASVYMDYSWDLAAAEREFQRAIALDPRYSMARQWYGLLLTAEGRNAEAFRQLEQAGEAEPLSPAMFVQLGHYFYYTHQYDRAAQEVERALALDPAFPRAHLLLALVDVQRGNAAQAVSRAEALRLRATEPAIAGVLGYALARAGRRPDAEKLRAELVAAGRARYVPAELLALVDVGLGDHARALADIERVCRNRSNGIVYLAVEPAMIPLRSEPRFHELVRAVGRSRSGAAACP